METIAVYWEPVIRVYGVEKREDVAFIEVLFPLNDLDFHGANIERLAEQCPDFIMALLQYIDPQTAKICIAINGKYARELHRELEGLADKGYNLTVELKEHIDLVFFHGPHFQDRYGIAETVFRFLDRNAISLLAVGCTGTSIYLVVNTGEAELTKTMLSEGFIVPEHKPKKH